MTSYALTHSKSFAMGIAGGTVTDWRALRLDLHRALHADAAEQPRGLRTARRVSRRRRTCTASCCSCTALIDDNVHLQNTMQFAYELQKAGKPFRADALPEVAPRRHRSAAGPVTCAQTMLDFTLEMLLKPRPGATTNDAGQDRRQ